MKNHAQEFTEELNLKIWRVTLHEDRGDKFQLAVDCLAQDADGAADFVSRIYPQGEILNATTGLDKRKSIGAKELAFSLGHTEGASLTEIIQVATDDATDGHDEMMSLILHGEGDSAHFAWSNEYGDPIGEKFDALSIAQESENQSFTDGEYVVYSPNESAASNGAGFWNNELGWVEFDGADKFKASEITSLRLPIATGGDAKWVTFDEAKRSYSQINDELPRYDHNNPIPIEAQNVSIFFKGEAFGAYTLVNQLHDAYDRAGMDKCKMINDFIFNLEVALQNAGILDDDFNDIVQFDENAPPPMRNFYFEGMAADAKRVAEDLCDAYESLEEEMPDAIGAFVRRCFKMETPKPQK